VVLQSAGWRIPPALADYDPPLEGASMLRLLIGPYLAMPMHWKWAAWFTSFALLLALWTRSFGAAVAVWVLLLFVIALAYAAFVLGQKHWQLSRGEHREHR
jgi:hypothetical protein